MTNIVSDPLKSLAEVCKPDERQAFFGCSLQELHAELSTLTLRDVVPVGVRQLFETAKNARLYTFFVYPFHQLAEMTAFQALERGLRERWNREIAGLSSVDDENFEAPGIRELLVNAVARGWLRKDGFSSRQTRAYLRLMSDRSHAAILKMQQSGVTCESSPEPSDDEIRNLAEQIDVPRILADHLPELRNQLAHGSQRLSPTSDFVLRDVHDAIAMLFDGTTPIHAPQTIAAKPPGLHKVFRPHLRDLEAKRRDLLSMQPFTLTTLPRLMPTRGVYLLSENGRHLYVGRSNGIRKRLRRHSRPSAKHNAASFAFRLAKEMLNVGPATYKKGQGRGDLASQDKFVNEFQAAKARIRAMQIRFVEEADPIRQGLLELYVAVVHCTPYNDFDTH